MNAADQSHITCSICGQPIPRNTWVQASLWHDPDGVVAVAHNDCLADIELDQ